MKHPFVWAPLVAVLACGGGDGPIPGAGVAAGDAGSATGDGGVPGAGDDGGAVPPAPSSSGRWVLGYYAGYQSAQYPVDAIEWSGLSHIAVAFYLPKDDGTLDETIFLDATRGPALAKSIVAAAHAHGKKAIASIGGAETRAHWLAALSQNGGATFLASLQRIVTSYGYDGLDLDWEPGEASDAGPIESLVKALRAAMPAATITTPAGYVNANTPNANVLMPVYPKIAPYVDQINLMTYGMAGAYSGWKSWHSSALHFTDGATPTSIESSIQAYLGAGVPAAKLGVGIGFYGLCYTPPVSAPDQALGGSTVAADDNAMSYVNIMSSYYTAEARKWDSTAHVPYLSFGGATGPRGCQYVSYDDEQSIADKGAWLKSMGLGGAIVWTINQGYLPSAPAGARNPLLVATGASILR